jgi:DNA invertase Pin-like site-specific DNA recombinase
MARTRSSTERVEIPWTLGQARGQAPASWMTAVSGERIRDKIAASKRKGMWMGGLPPLGYNVKDRKLVVDEREAETVRHIYRRYAALGSILALKDELDRDGTAARRGSTNTAAAAGRSRSPAGRST